jgi:sulfur dioxygenase
MMIKQNIIFRQLYDVQSSTYTYLIADVVSKKAALIDSVLENVDRDLKLIEDLNLRLIYVLETHIHADHITAAATIRKRFKVQIGVPQKANLACADLQLKEGDEIKLESLSITVLETPGHTDDSVSFYCENMVFTGDALLIGGTGRTDFQSGSSEALYDSITLKLFRLPQETIVYPAHDYNGLTSSSIENEKRHNPRVGQGKSKAEFIKIMSELKLAYPKKIDEALPANKVCGLI